MSFPDIGTVNPAHQLETTSNITAESLEIYSDYTFFSSNQYDYARQLRFRVKTPTSTNAFVDMGLEKNSGAYFYISKPLTSAGDPRNNFRIYQDGKILINRTDDTRTEKLQVGGDVRVTGNVTVNATTIVSGSASINGNLRTTSFSQENNYIVPEGMIVMWDGAVADIPPGWQLVSSGTGYYLRSNTNQTSVQTGNTDSFTISNVFSHNHTITNNTKTPASNNSHVHASSNSSAGSANAKHIHGNFSGNTNNTGHSHYSFDWGGGGQRLGDDYIPGVTPKESAIGTFTSGGNSGSHNHTATSSLTDSGSHNHNVNLTFDTQNSTHEHTVVTSGNVTNITVPLTPAYREVRLIKKLPYV